MTKKEDTGRSYTVYVVCDNCGYDSRITGEWA